ncbi:MAG: response regulator [Xenococcus sp. MO_188.B8]|nr:response regulator [Xenococcus sp. MO_188.B8]
MNKYENKKLEEGQKTILIVDDSVTVRDLLGTLFDKLGYRSIKAKDGVHALEICETIHIDLIFLDIEMPRMNGLEFLAEKRNLGIEIPTVILSSRGAERMRRMAAERGAIDYLVKPYNEERIRNCINSCLYSNLNPTEKKLRQLEFVNKSLKEENTNLKKQLELIPNIELDQYETILGSAIHSLKNEFFLISDANDEIVELSVDQKIIFLNKCDRQILGQL